MKLDSPLQFVKGVGPRKAEVLAKSGLETVSDMLRYFPRHYLDRTSVVSIGELKVDQSATIIGQVKAHGVLHGKHRRYEVLLDDGTGAIALLWFRGVRYWERLFKKGQIFAATGVVTSFQGLQMIHPDLERLEDDSGTMIHAGRIIPVYPQTAELNKVGLNSKGIRRVTSFIFENLKETISDPLPATECKARQLMPLHDAVKAVHYPESREQVELGRRRMAFDELLGFQFMVFRNRSEKEATIKAHSYSDPGEKLTRLREGLSFDLTSGQKKSIKEIFADLRRPEPMSRMLQGDVGCGKTVVAILTAAYLAENNLQTAFMAPTEILAEQHYRNWSERLNEVGISCGVLTASLKAAQKKKLAAQCADGEIDIVFGTHALIYDYVAFAKLGLVIIDEQHRFGVEQRAALRDKGQNPNLLVMTATPIPRSLALTVFGDLDLTLLDEMPPGRQPVDTRVIMPRERSRAHVFVDSQIGKGKQAFIIYPLVEGSEKVQTKAAVDEHQTLQENVFPSYKVGLLHGRMRQEEKDQVMNAFRKGENEVLVSTSVVEVGMDIPNATVMLIEGANHFGLAQLHQFRGRVGRGDSQSYCLLIPDRDDDVENARLTAMQATNDGFELADLDLEQRGPGDFLGTRQSGFAQLRAAQL
ncbi:MAG: ATP-dependent DNA helicase RecG, partial [candidate division Zixibacteria bacterium]|nr:ATP-dependent DNA helicase RecG [candidate division Zixibacteria bacterium]